MIRIYDSKLKEKVEFKPINPKEVRTQKDLEILKKCYAAFAPLDLKWLDFRNELHMTQDKDLFIESSNVAGGGITASL